VIRAGPPPNPEFGSGALMAGNVFTGDFRLVSGSRPATDDAGTRAFIFAFTTFDALNKLRKDAAWSAANAQLMSAPQLAAAARQPRQGYPPAAVLVLNDGEPVDKAELATFSVVPV
jgi:hypothetical protein